MTRDETFMFRCIELARMGAGYTAPNPMVGAILAHGDRIIGEGYHQQYGQAHAEVNCIASVSKDDEGLISRSTLYVSLEPCAHHGKTPPCADLIIRKKIPKVVVGCRDPFKEVDGKGIEKMRAAGIEVVTGVLENGCRDLNSRFFTFHTQGRPYVILKWAQTLNGRIGHADRTRLVISNEYSNRVVHKWRSEEASILVGTNTARHDDPSLTTRLWTGNDPVRLVIDMDLSLPLKLKLFDGSVRTVVFNTVKHEENDRLHFYRVSPGQRLVEQISNALYRLKIQSVIVEGGARLLQQFIDEGLWDEARVITNTDMYIADGLAAPVLGKAQLDKSEQILNDIIHWYRPNE
jgi:diaminohydroxyphosphoribosylaminopyrimidine deaminase / 5-amino-6-(5-phosphoribosylamino)uracil reductase